jgi:hypothetical protein
MVEGVDVSSDVLRLRRAAISRQHIRGSFLITKRKCASTRSRDRHETTSKTQRRAQMQTQTPHPSVPMKPAPSRGSSGASLSPGYLTHKRPVSLFSGSSYLIICKKKDEKIESFSCEGRALICARQPIVTVEGSHFTPMTVPVRPTGVRTMSPTYEERIEASVQSIVIEEKELAQRGTTLRAYSRKSWPLKNSNLFVPEIQMARCLQAP